MKKLLTILFFVNAALFAQVEYSGGQMPFNFFPGFEMDVANYSNGNPEKTRVDVFLKVPYSNIQFVKTPIGFLAKYSVTLTFYDEDEENIIFEKMWNEKIEVADFSQAVSTRNFKYMYKSFELAPDKYALRCEIIDSDSKKNFVINAIANVAEFNEPVNVSDIIFVSEKIQSKNGPRLIPSISNKVTSVDSSLYFFYEIFSDKPQQVTLQYKIEDKEENEVYSKITRLNIGEGSNFIEHEITNISFSLGSYNLIVQTLDEDEDVIVSKFKNFVSRIYGFPTFITDLELAVEQLTYIASNTDINFIEEASTYEEMLQRFKDFWQSKDPDPRTENNAVLLEYYRRIEYANAHFKHYFDGWKTDMGMVYIVLGPPSNVERHPFEYNAKPYEIWDYYQINKRFVFVDETGFGDYRLLDQQYGDWYRYRQ